MGRSGTHNYCQPEGLDEFFFHIRLFIIPPCPFYWRGGRGEMYSVLPIAMIGKSLNHRLSIYQRIYNFAPNIKKTI